MVEGVYCRVLPYSKTSRSDVGFCRGGKGRSLVNRVIGFHFVPVAERGVGLAHALESIQREHERHRQTWTRWCSGNGGYLVKARTWLIALVCLLGFALAASGSEWFTGSWSAEITLSPQQTLPFTAFESTLDMGITLDFLTLSSISDFVFDGWLWQSFDAGAEIGPFSFSSQLLFETQTGSFLYAQGMLAVEFYPITLSLYGAMVGETQSEPANYGYVIDVYGELFDGTVSFETATFLSADLSGITFTKTGVQTDSSLVSKTFTTDPTIDSTPITFCGQEITFSAFAFDCVQLTSITTFSKTGFESEEIDLDFLNLFGLPFNISLDFIYSLQTKSYVFTPSISSDYGCFSVYTNLVQSGSAITGIEIYGIAFELTIGNGTLRSVSNLDTSLYVISTSDFGMVVEPMADALAAGHLYYPQEYWEVVSLEVDVPPMGCGFTFHADTFFSESTGLLFDWAQTTMGATLALGSSVSIGSSITIDTTGFTEWTLSAELVW